LDPPAIVDHPYALAQGDDCFWPSLHGRAIGRLGYLEVLDAGEMFDDVFAGVVPHIDAVRELRTGLHGFVGSHRASRKSAVSNCLVASSALPPFSAASISNSIARFHELRSPYVLGERQNEGSGVAERAKLGRIFQGDGAREVS
jgi:hypothetical protein